MNEFDENEYFNLRVDYRRTIGESTSTHQELLEGEGVDYLPKVLDTFTRMLHGMGFDYITHLTAHSTLKGQPLDHTGEIYNG